MLIRVGYDLVFDVPTPTPIMFLLYLHLATGDARYLSYARSALDYEIAHGRIDHENAAWDRAEGDSMEVPYWRFGSSGIGSALIRFGAILGDSRYRVLADDVGRMAAAGRRCWRTGG